MKYIVGIFLGIVLIGCSLAPVYEPYPYSQTGQMESANSAVIWGLHDKQFIYFKKINGKKLPSRKGAGIPISIELQAGEYDIEVYYINPSAGAFDTTKTLKVTVEGGHTYTLNPEMIKGKRDVKIVIEDLGVEKKCHFEQYHKVNGAAHRRCG